MFETLNPFEVFFYGFFVMAVLLTWFFGSGWRPLGMVLLVCGVFPSWSHAEGMRVYLRCNPLQSGTIFFGEYSGPQSEPPVWTIGGGTTWYPIKVYRELSANLPSGSFRWADGTQAQIPHADGADIEVGGSHQGGNNLGYAMTEIFNLIEFDGYWFGAKRLYFDGDSTADFKNVGIKIWFTAATATDATLPHCEVFVNGESLGELYHSGPLALTAVGPVFNKTAPDQPFESANSPHVGTNNCFARQVALNLECGVGILDWGSGSTANYPTIPALGVGEPTSRPTTMPTWMEQAVVGLFGDAATRPSDFDWAAWHEYYREPAGFENEEWPETEPEWPEGRRNRPYWIDRETHKKVYERPTTQPGLVPDYLREFRFEPVEEPVEGSATEQIHGLPPFLQFLAQVFRRDLEPLPFGQAAEDLTLVVREFIFDGGLTGAAQDVLTGDGGSGAWVSEGPFQMGEVGSMVSSFSISGTLFQLFEYMQMVFIGQSGLIPPFMLDVIRVLTTAVICWNFFFRMLGGFMWAMGAQNLSVFEWWQLDENWWERSDESAPDWKPTRYGDQWRVKEEVDKTKGRRWRDRS